MATTAPGTRPAAFEWQPRDTPTGLVEADFEGWGEEDLVALARFHHEVAGDPVVGFWPEAIRRMPPRTRLQLAKNPLALAAWQERERERVENDPYYFIASYGSIQPEEGPPIQFNLWPDQREVLVTLHKERKVIVLKARQLGLTWIALHYAVWLLAFNPKTPRARILALSKNGADAKLLVERARMIVANLPSYLRPVEHPETRGSKESFGIKGRGRMRSLTSKPAAARMETATLVICDEFAFVENKAAPDVWQALQSTLGKRGKVFVISTGNGPAEQKGNGKGFAVLWQKARSGLEGLIAVFLPDSVHPDRDAAWRVAERGTYIDPEDFDQEHPETEEQALQGKSGRKVYLPKGVNRAEWLGRYVFDPLLRGEALNGSTPEEWAEMAQVPDPLDGVIHTGADFGEFTGLLVAWPLEGGGLYIPPSEVYSEGGEVGLVTAKLMRRLAKLQEDGEDGLPWPPVYHARYDAAGVQSHRTFRRTIQENPDYLARFEPKTVGAERRIRSFPVAFGKWKDDTKDYLRWLFRRTAQGETTGIIVISPENKKLLEQLRGLELDDEGKIVKANDHLPDALIAAAAPIAKRYHGRRAADEDLEEEKDEDGKDEAG